MGVDFNVNVGEVRAHAQNVGNIAENVRSVAGGASDSVSGGAFGQIAEFFASAITGAADVVRQSMNNAGQSVDQVQTGLRETADGYELVEDRHVQVFSTAGAAGSAARRSKTVKKVVKKAEELEQLTNSANNTIKTAGEGQSTAQRRAR